MVFIYIIKLLQRSGKRFEKASLFLTRGRLIFSETSLINSQIRSFRAPPLVSQAYLQRSSKRFEKASLFLTRGRVHIATSQFPSASTDIWLITMFTFAFAHLHLCPAFAAECGLPPGLLHHSVGSMLRPASGQPRPSDQRSHLKVS